MCYLGLHRDPEVHLSSATMVQEHTSLPILPHGRPVENTRKFYYLNYLHLPCSRHCLTLAQRRTRTRMETPRCAIQMKVLLIHQRPCCLPRRFDAWMLFRSHLHPLMRRQTTPCWTTQPRLSLSWRPFPKYQYSTLPLLLVIRYVGHVDKRRSLVDDVLQCVQKDEQLRQVSRPLYHMMCRYLPLP